MNRAQYILEAVFGFKSFLPLQEKIIAHILKKKDALVVMPTGGGKSLCYQIPGIIFEGLTIVVSPLISLMKDQVDQLREYSVPALYLNSTLSMDEYRTNVAKLKENRAKLLYIAPETLVSPRTLALLSDMKVDCLAIDEAHCISDWGHDFRPEYRQLAEVHATFPSACCVALTATATPRVREDIRHLLNIDSQHEYIGSFNRPNLFLEVAPKTEPVKQVISMLERYPNESGIIYCATRTQTDRLYSILSRKGYSVRPYHAGLSEKDRTENQDGFNHDDVRIIVATIAFGMGINKPNVRFVVHYDMPGSIDSYYQEIGRAGRDGLPAHCLFLFSYGDIQKIQFFIKQKKEQEQRVANILLSQIIGFAETDFCRRVPLLHYFGETEVPDRCGMCDNCKLREKGEDRVDLTVQAQMFLSCVKRTGELFGASHIIDVLRGSKSQKVLKFGHERLSTYGIGTAFSTKQWRQIVAQMVQKNLLLYDYAHGSLKLTQKAWEVLREEKTFFGKLGEDQKERSEVRKQEENEIGSYDSDLFEALRKKRKELADQKNLPPFVIFHDRTLKEMAHYYPQTRESLSLIYGIGRIKLENYADVFLDIIREYCQNHQIRGQQKLEPIPKQEPIPKPLPTPSPPDAGRNWYLESGSNNKTFVCLAASRKYGGHCIAGKEWTKGKAGHWLRPVSKQATGELSNEEIRMTNGHVPQCMDIITIKTNGVAPHSYQRENVLISGESPWIWEHKLPLDALPFLVDKVKSLWLTGFNDKNERNDRLSQEAAKKTDEPSLYLIRPDDFTLVVSDDIDGRKKVRARFSYNGTMYLLAVTDPLIEKAHLIKERGEYPLVAKDIYLTISLGEPFQGYCYKLVAAVITVE